MENRFGGRASGFANHVARRRKQRKEQRKEERKVPGTNCPATGRPTQADIRSPHVRRTSCPSPAPWHAIELTSAFATPSIDQRTQFEQPRRTRRARRLKDDIHRFILSYLRVLRVLRGTQIATTVVRPVTLVVERGSTRGDAFEVLATDKMSVVQSGGWPRSKPTRRRLNPPSSFTAEP
ncbi:MAG: hypothetical protein RLY70_4765 [Planctomycetota bacterium]